MALLYRRARAEDARAAEHVTREAFWNHFVPGADEHWLLHTMRAHPDFVPELEWVAEDDGEIVGHIAYARAGIEQADGARRPVLTFGPVSVLPARQHQGIGAALIRRTLQEAEALHFQAVCIYGDPRYYSRFGFRIAERYGIMTSDGHFAVALMALPLMPDGLSGCAGRFVEGSAYEIDKAGLDAFDKTFPHKDKVSDTPSQRVFDVISSLRYEA